MKITALVLGISLIAEAGHARQSTASRGKPNIVFILMDNLGYGEVGVYGGGITRGAPTPRIDKLAAEGTRLTNFNVERNAHPAARPFSPADSRFAPGRIPCRSAKASTG